MALTYTEFKKIVPKETSDFFDTLLPYLSYYFGNNYDISFSGTDTKSSNSDSKVFYLSLYALSEAKEYMAFLGELGFKKSLYRINPANLNKNIDLESLYEKYNYLLPVHNDKTLYYGLQPLEIVSDAYQKYYNRSNHYLFDEVFGVVTLSSFKQKITDEIDEKKQIQDREIEKEIYTNIPISVISHIETASKIRTLLLNKLSYSQNGIAKELDIDIVPLSLLLALFYNNNNNQTKDNLNNQGALVCLLQEKGITLEKILKVLNISLNQNEIKNAPKNIFAIKNLYEKYYKLGNTNNINPSSVSIQGIIKSILNRSFTNSLVIEKLLSSLDCNIDMFKNIEADTLRAVETQKRNIEQENIKSFYKDVPKKTRDFIEFAVKTYSLLIEKMHENKHNDKILSTEQDAVILSLYIASMFHNSNLSEFFNDNGVSLAKVLKLLNIELKKEDIVKREVNQKILVDKFKRFVYEGENRNVSTSKLGINEICQNMCNRDFNQSMMLENIFNSLSPDIEISSNFLSQMKEYFVNKSKRLEIEKTQKLFYDMPVETIKIIENASRLYQKLSKSKKGLDKKGIQTISVLISALDSNDVEVRNFLNEQGFYLNSVCNYFEIDNRYLKSSPIDIDILSKDYGLLMFGLANKDRKREELTPLNIIRNLFSKEFNNSVAISKFLSECKTSYEQLSDFDSLYKSFLAKQEKEKREKEIKDSISGYPQESCNQIKNATRIQRLIETRVKDKVKDESELETLCMVLALFCESSNTRDFFEKNNINIETLTNAFNLPNNLLYNYSSLDIDYELLNEKYKKYLKGDSSKNRIYVSDIFRCLIEDSDYIKTIAGLTSSNYEILEREITTGKRYEETLTVSDRIKNLAREEVENLDSSDMQSILDFGNSLLPHSKYIHSEIPNLMKSDVNANSITAITSILDSIYVTEETQKKEQGLFAKLFKGEEEAEEPRLLVNRSQLYNLKNTIDSHLDKLKKDLLKYDEIRKYIEAYIAKNKDYYERADEALININQRLSELNPDDDADYADYLTTTSIMQIVNDKQTRFATVNLLMKKELLRVNQAIVNHFVTINSLEMARDDLIPLIESELVINNGQENEKEALDLSRNVIGLFSSLLNRNIDSAIENMDKIQRSTVSPELIASINNDINTYIQGVSQIKLLESKIEGQEEPTTKKVLEKNKK